MSKILSALAYAWARAHEASTWAGVGIVAEAAAQALNSAHAGQGVVPYLHAAALFGGTLAAAIKG